MSAHPLKMPPIHLPAKHPLLAQNLHDTWELFLTEIKPHSTDLIPLILLSFSKYFEQVQIPKNANHYGWLEGFFFPAYTCSFGGLRKETSTHTDTAPLLSKQLLHPMAYSQLCYKNMQASCQSNYENVFSCLQTSFFRWFASLLPTYHTKTLWIRQWNINVILTFSFLTIIVQQTEMPLKYLCIWFSYSLL